jgi:integrase
MASIQKKGDGWYCQFMFSRRRHTFAVGKVDEAEAEAIRARVEYVLMRLKQGLMKLPAGADIVTFVLHDGRPPSAVVDPAPSTTLREFRDAYLEAFRHGAIESNSHDTATIHLSHVSDTLGERFLLADLSTAELQRHVDRRRKDVAGVTIKKEIDTFRSAWNWAGRMGHVRGDFPGTGLVFPKDREKLPFMTWPEVERRVTAGGNPDELWECLYLTVPELDGLLEHVRVRRAPSWVYPIFLFAAHTGARRSEMIRARAEDVDLAGGVVTVREKKRVRGRLTTRRVPLSGSLAAALGEWLPGRTHLFGPGQRPLSVQGAQKAFGRVLKDSRWSVLKGWHVLRHSFISSLASRGIDQRLIDEWVGHQTEAMRRRYRHLTPDVQQQAIRSVFG